MIVMLFGLSTCQEAFSFNVVALLVMNTRSFNKSVWLS